MFHQVTYWIVLALAVPVFWALPRGLRYGFLGLVSAGLMASLDWFSVVALSVWILIFHLLAPYMAPGRKRFARVAIGAGLGILGFLAYFKYIPPLIDQVAGKDFASRILIPLGISYYSFKLVHYAVEVARGTIKEHSFQQFFCYMMLFPIFTAGPIERYDHFLAGQEHSPSRAAFVEGVWRIMVGMIKKFLLAQAIDEAFLSGPMSGGSFLANLPGFSASQVWVRIIATYGYVYLDFSAYTDIALGSSRLFGLRIMENFFFPIVAPNIREYWRRWHISLSAWCQSYIYMPVLGLWRKPLISLYLTFFVMGLWHEGSLNRIGWGVYHATGVAIYTAWNRYRKKRKWKFFDRPLLQGVGIVFTQLFVSGSMVFLVERRQALYQSVRIFAKMVSVDLPA